MPAGPPLFSRANLNPHYWPFRGVVWSIVVHASIFTGLVYLPVLEGRERPRLREEAIVIEPDDLKDVLYLPVLGANVARNAAEDRPKAKDSEAPGKEGLSYPGPQPILSNFPKVTNHIQTILQPTLVNPPILEPPLSLPNLVRLAPPAVEPRFKAPDAETAQVRPPMAPVPQLEALTGPARPLAAPAAEAKFKAPEVANPVVRPTLTMPVAPTDLSLSGPSRPLAAPLAESKFKVADAASPVARPALTTPVAPTEVSLTAQVQALAAPKAEPRFRLPDSAAATIARPALTVTAGPAEILLPGTTKPLAAPFAESKFKVTDAAATPAKQANVVATAPLTSIDLPTGPARPLAAPLAESKFKVADSAAPASVVRPNAAPATTPMEVSLSGPARPLAAPVAESKFKVADAAAPTARPAPTPIAPTDNRLLSALDSTQNLLTLSPTPARRDQPAVIPAGEARGQFAISPQPNLTFPGTEPGTKAGNGNAGGAGNPTAGNAVAANNAGPSASNSNGSTNAAAGTRSGPGRDAFPGITILSGGDPPGASRNATPNAPQPGPIPEPLQTSYGIMILASGRSGGGLPDFGVFSNEQVHTVYLDMRRTIQDPPISWTAEFGVPPRPTTAQNERVAAVGSQQEVVLPFPITKERPVFPAELVRKYPGRMVIAYAVVTVEGKVEQLAIKDSPDPLFNEIVLSALKKWTFRPGRRDGEVIAAKLLLGIPLRAD
jgi:hypothetical protein